MGCANCLILKKYLFILALNSAYIALFRAKGQKELFSFVRKQDTVTPILMLKNTAQALKTLIIGPILLIFHLVSVARLHTNTLYLKKQCLIHTSQNCRTWKLNVSCGNFLGQGNEDDQNYV